MLVLVPNCLYVLNNFVTKILIPILSVVGFGLTQIYSRVTWGRYKNVIISISSGRERGGMGTPR